VPDHEDESAAAAPAPPGVVRVARREGWRGFGFVELWLDRELLIFLAARDLKVRYKQTFFGAAWAVGQPLITMLVFTFVFGHLAKVGSEHLPYSVFALGGLVPWGLAASAVPTASLSLISNVPLITKVRIHNMLVPTATVVAGILDLAIAIVLLVVYAGAHGIWPGPEVVALPLFIALDVAIVVGVSLLLSAVTVIYRDIRYAVPFIVQIWLFLTPIAYPASRIKGGVRWLYALNPMVGVIEGFRWSMLGASQHLGSLLPVSVLGAVILSLGGAYVFRRLEPLFPDVV